MTVFLVEDTSGKLITFSDVEIDEVCFILSIYSVIQ